MDINIRSCVYMDWSFIIHGVKTFIERNCTYLYTLKKWEKTILIGGDTEQDRICVFDSCSVTCNPWFTLHIDEIDF
jgi:hypothetical protein